MIYELEYCLFLLFFIRETIIILVSLYIVFELNPFLLPMIIIVSIVLVT